ncbi:secreted RxLR effector protein 161-like [Rutidosis leptorrhynchoides]|uniref:secreted RxLR effector protein 161-like n=1 Tax=Rutidosis leptorrhynchoides TaxID=125765 RepID=UPI003A9A019F
MEDCNGISTPMENQLKLEPTKIGEEFDSSLYRSMIGSLMYLCASRPDIACSVYIMASFSANPSKTHAVYLKRILRYVKYSLNFGIWFKTDGNRELLVFSDASYAMGENYRSRSGYCCSFGSRIFSWSSRNQTVVAQSTAEAEFISVNHAARQAAWLKKILSDIGELKENCVKIFCDSSSAIAMAENPDIFTKPLQKWRFDALTEMIGITQAPLDEGGAVGVDHLEEFEIIEAQMAVRKKEKKKSKLAVNFQ